MAEGKVDDALAELQHQVAHMPDLSVAHYTLGLAHWSKGDTSQARIEFQSADKTSPGHGRRLEEPRRVASLAW